MTGSLFNRLRKLSSVIPLSMEPSVVHVFEPKMDELSGKNAGSSLLRMLWTRRFFRGVGGH